MAKAKPNITGLYANLYDEYQAGRETGRGLFGTGLQSLQQAADLFAPGGAFEKSAMEQYETGKRKALSSGMQNLISSGLAKTSTPAALERGYEQEVGTPFRTAVAAEGQGRLASALQNIANYGLQYQNLYPSAGTLSYLATGGFGALSSEDARQQALTASQPSVTERLAALRGGGGFSAGSSPFGGAGSWFGGGGSSGKQTSGSGGQRTLTTYGPQSGAESTSAPAEMMMGADPGWNASYWAGRVPSTTEALASGGMMSDVYERSLGMSPGSSGTTVPITVQHYTKRGTGDTKTIQVPQDALGGGPGGFVNTAMYQQYIPSGYEIYNKG